MFSIRHEISWKLCADLEKPKGLYNVHKEKETVRAMIVCIHTYIFTYFVCV